MLDGLVAGEVQTETVKHFDGPQADQKQMQLEETGGIPTGVAPIFTGRWNCGKPNALPRLIILHSRNAAESTVQPTETETYGNKRMG
jgi:hypothetical protein